MLSCCFLLSEASSNVAGLKELSSASSLESFIFPTSDFWFPLPKDPQKWETTTVSPQELRSTLKTKTCHVMCVFTMFALKSWLFQNCQLLLKLIRWRHRKLLGLLGFVVSNVRGSNMAHLLRMVSWNLKDLCVSVVRKGHPLLIIWEYGWIPRVSDIDVQCSTVWKSNAFIAFSQHLSKQLNQLAVSPQPGRCQGNILRMMWVPCFLKSREQPPCFQTPFRIRSYDWIPKTLPTQKVRIPEKIFGQKSSKSWKTPPHTPPRKDPSEILPTPRVPKSCRSFSIRGFEGRTGTTFRMRFGWICEEILPRHPGLHRCPEEVWRGAQNTSQTQQLRRYLDV